MVRLAVLSCLTLTLLAGCATTDTSTYGGGEHYGDYAQGSNHPAVITLFQQADMAGQGGNWAAAMTYLDQARRIEPRNPYVLYRQAWVSYQSGDTERARQLLERARVYADPEDDLLAYRLYELSYQLDPDAAQPVRK